MSVRQLSRQLAEKSWAIVRETPGLARFPVMSVVFAVGAFIPFAIAAGALAAGDVTVASIAALVVGAAAATFAAIYVTGGLVGAADELLAGRGGDDLYQRGMATARAHRGALFRWSLVQVTVGWLLAALRGGSGNDNVIVTVVRVLVASLLGAAWALLTLFVLPLIVLEGLGVRASMKESLRIVRARWGTAVVGSLRISLRIALLFIIPAFILIGLGVFLVRPVLVAGVALIAVGAVLLIVGAVLQQLVTTVFTVALYRYASTGEPVGPFTTEEMAAALVGKGRQR